MKCRETHGKIAREYQTPCSIDQNTAYRDPLELVNREILRREGKDYSTRYLMIMGWLWDHQSPNIGNSPKNDRIMNSKIGKDK